MSTRKATHACSWYSDNEEKLTHQLDQWLSLVPDTVQVGDKEFQFPVPNARAIISPHAGYSYSGKTAAWAYKSLDLSQVHRVFILGPSHHVYLKGCALSTFTKLETPLGPLDVDVETIDKLHKTSQFIHLSPKQQEAEHSLEMQFPYLKRLFDQRGKACPVVPIIIGSIGHAEEQKFGKIFAPYLASPHNAFVISSDFCHWGDRFDYTFYSDADPPSSKVGDALEGTYASVSARTIPIHKSISALDHEGMQIIEGLNHRSFTQYLSLTGNTICGRHPIAVLLAALSSLEEDTSEREADMPHPIIRFVQYAQSNPVSHPQDSSVSYASAFLQMNGTEEKVSV
ncbi:MAG: UPF0103-domain-containing protein [Piptocephalis tieghemiana]|nr:MAG: UPF0103-domain-containing protein [Piptocephalis tieghemiana]